jgi:membrane-bound inhibitor of C-type lysozyme
MRALFWLIVLTLPACTSVREFNWHCASGASFTLHYDSRQQAIVSANEQVYVLPAALAASGARYSDGTVEYWEHQGEATLRGIPGARFEHCKLKER